MPTTWDDARNYPFKGLLKVGKSVEVPLGLNSILSLDLSFEIVLLSNSSSDFDPLKTDLSSISSCQWLEAEDPKIPRFSCNYFEKSI